MPDMDLVIAGGTVVTAQGRNRLNVAVQDGRISYVGP
jgi:predicted amidohydrolase YtcJ